MCCAIHFNLLSFHKLFVSVASFVKVLCGDIRDQLGAVTTPVKLGRLRKFAVRRRNKSTIRNVYKFVKNISEQPEYFSNISGHVN